MRALCIANDTHILSTKNNSVFVIFMFEILTNVVDFEQLGTGVFVNYHQIMDEGLSQWLVRSKHPVNIGTASFEPRREKTGLRGFRPGLTQTDLYSHRSEISDIRRKDVVFLPMQKQRQYAKLISAFVFATPEPLLSKFGISSLWPSSVLVPLSLFPETRKTGFLASSPQWMCTSEIKASNDFFYDSFYFLFYKHIVPFSSCRVEDVDSSQLCG